MPGNWKNQFSDDVGGGGKEENVLENFCILCRNEKCF